MKRLGLCFLFLMTTEPLLGGQWEYLKVLNTKSALSIDSLNVLGKQCWELVACPLDNKDTGRKVYLDGATFVPYAFAVSHYCIFKRPNPRQEGADADTCT